MSALSDQQLLQLAADRPEPVLTVLKRAKAFRPLVFVLALIPGLIVIQRDELMRHDSLFILQCLDYWNGTFTAPFSLPYWMTGLSLQLSELSLSWRFLLPTYLCGVLLVLMVFMLTQTMLNSRCGLLTALLLLTHPYYLDQLTHQVTPMCGLALLMVSLWGYQRHLQQNTLFSPYLLVGAVAAGINMFVSPPYPLFVVAWLIGDLVLMTLLRYFVPRPNGTKTNKEIGMSNSIRFRFISIAGIGAIIAASGLFLFSMRWLREEEFTWLVPQLTPVSWEEQQLLHALLGTTGFLIGFVLIGLIVCLKLFFAVGRPATRYRFWLIGLILSGSVWFSSNQALQHLPDLVASWKLLFTVALLVLAAISLDKILEREVPVLQTIFAFLVAVLIGLGYTLSTFDSLNIGTELVALLLIALIAWRLWDRVQRQEIRARFLLSVGLLCLLLMCIANGFLLRKETPFFAENVNQFEKGIHEVTKSADRFFVISEQDLQPTIRAILRLQWMNRPLEHYRNWNEALNKLKSADQFQPPAVLVINTESLVAPDLASTLPGWGLQPIGKEYYLQHYVLRCYLAERK
ncbi:MAG: glycosyltransferase family 39 protein [Planctomycetaceae bacterium]|nr:glycosyltransferase family 39 protein [Planctomycetaceae bacterium]